MLHNSARRNKHSLEDTEGAVLPDDSIRACTTTNREAQEKLEVIAPWIHDDHSWIEYTVIIEGL